MFELSFIRKYLTPKRKQLSVSLIALLSIAVITLVVWLVAVFISVTEGIEKNWLDKLTTLNAPLRVIPTQEYFSSYYYNADRYSEASEYTSKTIGQKAVSPLSDPYDPDFDEELPSLVSKADRDSSMSLIDPVKELYGALEELRPAYQGLVYQDIEMSGALLRLDLIRKDPDTFNKTDRQSHLTNVSYLASFPEKNPSLNKLLIPPTEEDINHLIYLARRANNPSKLDTVLAHTKIKNLSSDSSLWPVHIDLIPEKTPFSVQAYKHEGQISHIIIPIAQSVEGKNCIERRGSRLFFMEEGKPEIPLEEGTPLFSYGPIEFSVEDKVAKLSFLVSGLIQNKSIQGNLSLSEGLHVAKATYNTEFSTLPEQQPLWPFFSDGIGHLPTSENETGILLAKNFKDNGVRIGDSGYLAYNAPSMSATKEVHLPVYISGFYDPGIMAVGNKCILVPPSITRAINATESAFTLDRSESNQVFVWLKSIEDSGKVKAALIEKLSQRGIDKYWKVQTFREYEFAKDLMQQFDSDKYLFSLIGVIILLVACTNIISLLVLLVADKKKEIGILRAMGAKRRSIAAIFAFSGATLGIFSCTVGVLLAFFTLKNIDSLVYFLSSLQGHDAFNPQFFGTSLPHEISHRALLFAAIATPILSLLAGLVPAFKAARLNPCESLRSE